MNLLFANKLLHLIFLSAPCLCTYLSQPGRKFCGITVEHRWGVDWPGIAASHSFHWRVLGPMPFADDCFFRQLKNLVYGYFCILGWNVYSNLLYMVAWHGRIKSSLKQGRGRHKKEYLFFILLFPLWKNNISNHRAQLQSWMNVMRTG